MYVCIHRAGGAIISLSEFAWEHSPLVEATADDTAILEVRDAKLAGTLEQIKAQAERLASEINIAAAANPDAAVLAAENIKGITVITVGCEAERLSHLTLATLVPLLTRTCASTDENRIEEIFSILELWGIRTLGDLAALPVVGISERLGSIGILMQSLARGTHQRHLRFWQPERTFQASQELDSPIESLEQLSALVSHLMTRICAELAGRGLATSEIVLTAVLDDKSRYERRLPLPFPTQDKEWLSKRLLIDIDAARPCAAIQYLTIVAEPAAPRRHQEEFFESSGVEAEAFEITKAKLVRLVGVERIGSPELLNTHRRDRVKLNNFNPGERYSPRLPRESRLLLGFRFFRPPEASVVKTMSGRPFHLKSGMASGEVLKCAGPWKASGDWWADKWSREEWDVLLDAGLYRIFREGDRWYVEGAYD